MHDITGLIAKKGDKIFYWCKGKNPHLRLGRVLSINDSGMLVEWITAWDDNNLPEKPTRISYGSEFGIKDREDWEL